MHSMNHLSTEGLEDIASPFKVQDGPGWNNANDIMAGGYDAQAGLCVLALAHSLLLWFPLESETLEEKCFKVTQPI
jgi:hypothetical protein